MGFPGGRIAMPAVANPSTDPNTFDDCERGTFTPAVSSATGTITTVGAVSGVYVKLGQFVDVLAIPRLHGCARCLLILLGLLFLLDFELPLLHALLRLLLLKRSQLKHVLELQNAPVLLKRVGLLLWCRVDAESR